MLPRRLTFLAALLLPAPAAGQALSHPDPHLHYVYPAGGQRGQTVAVELGGLNGLASAKELVIEGLPGIKVREVKSVSHAETKAVLEIARDATPGRRLLRLAGGSAGLTNFRYFHVGTLPELREKEANDTSDRAQDVTLPAVINGRLNPALDVDCFRFRARAGQKLVAAVLAHRMDSLLRGGRLNGYLDTSLELLDAKGRVLAAADDTLGLDPLLELTVPADGLYAVRVTALGYPGAPSAVYRLTVGEVPYPTWVFPPGGQRGRKVWVEFGGPNVPAGSRRVIEVPADGGSPVLGLTLDQPNAAPVELPFVAGHHPERVEAEPNDDRASATALALPVTVNGRFDRTGDADWFRVSLKKGRGVLLEVTAQRHLNAPVDSLLEVHDDAGKKVAENDDGPLFAGQCEHDFPSADSWLPFTAPADGDYFVRVSDQSGAAGPRAVYRLTATELGPGFHLYQWPDAVPVWGPGSTASLVIQVQRWGDLKGDINLSVEGLPPGWGGSVGNLPAAGYVPPNGPTNQKALLTITAPADAKVGQHVPFRVVGRAEHDGKRIERVAQPLTLYGSSFNDRLHFRLSSASRAAVAPPLDCRLDTPVKELTAVVGGTVNVPVKVSRLGGKAEIGITVDGETPAAGCGWRTPLTLKANETEVILPLEISRERRPGVYGVVVSRSWASDLRAGRPGPCTPLIRLRIEAAKAK